jgi:nitrogen fixation/metabolism regulation signal transduction histidine kinase
LDNPASSVFALSTIAANAAVILLLIVVICETIYVVLTRVSDCKTKERKA